MASLDGAEPNAGLVEVSDGNLYGTLTVAGPAIVARFPDHHQRTLTRFIRSRAGTTGFSAGGLVQASDGNLYGKLCTCMEQQATGRFLIRQPL